MISLLEFRTNSKPRSTSQRGSPGHRPDSIRFDVHVNWALDRPPAAVYFPSMLAKEQISRMSSSERVEAMELLWESFSTEGIEYPSPDWHGKVLADRSEIIDSGKATWLSVDELQARLTSR